MKKLFPLLLCCILLCGCAFPDTPQETTPPETQTLPNQPSTDPINEPRLTAVTIYYGNKNADGFETTEVMVEDVNMNVLVEELIQAGVLTEDVSIGAMQFDGTCLHLKFNPAFGDLVCSMGTSGEYIVIGSVVNTFLDAWPDYDTVFITIGNEILESGHVVYDFELTRFG